MHPFLRTRAAILSPAVTATEPQFLPEDALAHLRRLVAGWGMLADLCFADLLLFVPAAGADGRRFTIIGQMRPTTGQTLHRDDLVGATLDESDRPLVAQSLRSGEIV